MPSAMIAVHFTGIGRRSFEDRREMGRARAEDDDLGALPSEFGKRNVVRCQVARDSTSQNFTPNCIQPECYHSVARYTQRLANSNSYDSLLVRVLRGVLHQRRSLPPRNPTSTITSAPAFCGQTRGFCPQCFTGRICLSWSLAYEYLRTRSHDDFQRCGTNR